MSDIPREEFQRAYRRVLEAPAEERWALIQRDYAAQPALRERLEQLFSPDGEDLFLIPPSEEDERPRELDIDAGIQLGDFELERELGRGGMGVVYLAHQRSLGRPVALKLLRPSVGAELGSQQEFLEEARAIARLRHPGVVPVYTVGEAAGFPYFALEYVPGRNLAEELEAVRAGGESVLPPLEDPAYFREAARLVAEVADALAHAHQQGILHRDLKPSNILVDGDGQARLTDFGLAKAHVAGAASVSKDLRGTVHYLCPEQLRTRAPQYDERSDLFALGAVLYEALTGQRAFPGDGLAEVLQNVQRAAPTPVRQLAPRVSRELALICETALARLPEDRYASVVDFAADLRRFLNHEAISVDAPTWSIRAGRWTRRHRLGLALFLMATVSLAVGATFAEQLRAHWERPQLEVRAIDPQGNALLREGRVSLRPIDLTTGTVGERQRLGPLPLEGLRLEPGYYRIVVEYADGWFTEHTRDLVRGEAVEVQSVHRERPFLEDAHWATVPAGDFRIPEDAPALWPFRGETVRLQGYQLARTEASIGHYRAYLLATGRSLPAWWQGLDWQASWDELPITFLSWEEFRDFAEWCGARLPTFHEWQRAAHGSQLRSTTWVRDDADDWRGNTQGEEVLKGAIQFESLDTPQAFRWVAAQLVAVDDARGDRSLATADAVGGLLHLVGNARELTETMALQKVRGRLQPARLSRYTSGVTWEAAAYGIDLRTVSDFPITDEYRQVTNGVRLARSLIP